MKHLNERAQVRAVAAAWRRQYPPNSDYMTVDGNPDDVLHALEALDVETATAKDVAKIIGNGSWVEPKECHECSVTSWNVVQVGQEPDYESATAQICGKCLRKALALIGKSQKRTAA